MEDSDDIALFEAFEKEDLELKKLTDEKEGLKEPSIEDLNNYEAICQNTMKQIQCYKNIYNLGKKNNVSWNYLYENVLLKGVDVGLSPIRSAFSSKQMPALLTGNGVHLYEEVEKLLKTAKTMDDALGVTNEERFAWQNSQDRFKIINSFFDEMLEALSSAFPSKPWDQISHN